MKMTKKKSDRVEFVVTQEEYDRELARGIAPDEMLAPGKHVGIRGGFLKRHPGLTVEQVREAIAEAQGKVSVSIRLDSDILTFFKKRSEDPLAAGYQTQINAVLREYMEARQVKAVPRTKQSKGSARRKSA